MPTRSTLLPVLFALCAAPAWAAGGGDRVALLPLAAEGVALDEVPELQRLDDELRKAISALPDVRLQPRDDTLAHVAGARDVGLNCPPDDAACLGKLAVLAEIDVVLTASARLTPEAFDVTLRLVERGGAQRSRQATLPRDNSALPGAAMSAVRSLWEAAPVASAAAPVDETPPAAPAPAATAAAPSVPATEPMPTTTTAPPAEDEGGGGGLLWVGVGTGVGVVALLAAIGGGLAAVLLLAPPPAAGPAVLVME